MRQKINFKTLKLNLFFEKFIKDKIPTSYHKKFRFQIDLY